jgi:hypothetical protein
MRSYLGERDATGRPTVWILNEAPRPEIREINDLLADLPAPRDPVRAEDDWPERHAAWLVRKQDLIARIEAAEGPARRPLQHIEVHSSDGFEWGYAGSGPADLAHAVLTDHLGVEPTDTVRIAFRNQVIAALPAERFRIPGSLVGAWVAANRELVDRELFLMPPEGARGQAWSVTESSSPPVGATVDVTDDPASASALLAACESAWRDIRAHHPELPDAVIVLGTGVERGRLVKLGHWWGGQWVADGQARGEVLLAGEALHLEPARVFEVLLHEAAHGINAARGVKDTSRGGRYHNQHFATTARQVLLRVRAMPPYGLAATDLTPEALDRYASTIERLGDAMRIARQLRAGLRVGVEGGEIDGTVDAEETGGKDTTGGQPKADQTAAACGCGRKMRMAPSTFAAGPVHCGLCGTEFTNGREKRLDRPDRIEAEAVPSDADAPRRAQPADSVIASSFLDRRQAAIAAEPDPHPVASDPVARLLQQQRARLEAVLRSAPDPADPILRPLTERRDRLEALLRDAAAPKSEADSVTAPGSVSAVGQADADFAALQHWYERYGTGEEGPMPADTPADGARRERLARALLKGDGTLTGPVVTTSAGAELQSGDRVQVVAHHGDLPAGTPGTIERVDPRTGVIEVDFATWGRLQAALTDSLTRDLRHDYAEVQNAGPGMAMER